MALRCVNFFAIYDTISSQGYDPSQQLSELIQNLRLTPKGERIIRGTRAELQNADSFNNSCKRFGENIVLLGCYSSNQIFVYNIDDRDLRGVREATLAHELLHAIWARMSAGERDAIKPALDKVYEENEDLQEHLRLYESTEYYDELHSIVGSQINSDQLPENLRAHYAKYFIDPNVPANYYHQYSDKLIVIEKRIDELVTKIESTKSDVEVRRQKYNLANEKLSEDIADYNSRNSRGLIGAEQANIEREALVKRQENLSTEYTNLVNLIADYNVYVEEYNQYVNFTNKVYKSMDSKAEKAGED